MGFKLFLQLYNDTPAEQENLKRINAWCEWFRNPKNGKQKAEWQGSLF